MGVTGLEPDNLTIDGQSKLAKVNKLSGADSGADLPDLPQIDPDLQKLIDAWPELPEHIKAAINALVQTHNKK